MPLQDLTPQLRTRLSRMERVVGWFVLVATALMLFAFGYYIYRTAELRGWNEVKAGYYTYAESGAGLATGDPVDLMGFEVGRITKIYAMPPRGKGSDHNVRIEFEVIGTNYNYIWTDSRARFAQQGFLGKQELDITKGTKGHYNTYINYEVKRMTPAEIQASPHLEKLRLGEDVYRGTNLAVKAWTALSTNLPEMAALGLSNLWTIDATARHKRITAVWNDDEHRYEPFAQTNIYGLPPDETPALMDRVQGLVSQIETALPNFLRLTNQIAAALDNSVQLTSNLNAVAKGLRPAITNVAVITANLRNPQGSLGDWLIPTNLHQQLAATLWNANGAVTNANGALTNVNTNLVAVFNDLGRSLDNVANLTSNLDNQVQVNSNILSRISDIIVHSDEFVQGLKRHWLLRSAFKTPKTNAPAAAVPSGDVLVSPKERR